MGVKFITGSTKYISLPGFYVDKVAYTYCTNSYDYVELYNGQSAIVFASGSLCMQDEHVHAE